LSESGNVELVRNAFDLWSRGEHESLLEQIDPDAEISVSSAQLARVEPFRGHEGYREWTATMEDSFDLWQIHPEVFHERGDRVVVLGHMRLRGRGSGVELDQPIGWLIELRDGKMTRFQTFRTHEEALEAGGIS
jgi:ketosteroid isomerase-like protein